MHGRATWIPSARCAAFTPFVAVSLGPALGLAQAVLGATERATSPFAETVRVLCAIDGAGAGEQFGWVARAVGDVDGDGVADVLITAAYHGASGAKSGRVDVLSGASIIRQ